jgi:hypothetical protein
LTELIELGIAVSFGLRHTLELAAIALVNVITNPLMNYLLSINFYFDIISQRVALLIALEIIVVFSEWRLLVWILNLNSKKMFILSSVMNICSCLAGLFVFR